MKPTKYICPTCKQKSGVNILYGMPSNEGFEMADRGEIAIGGCCAELGRPERKCLLCGNEWRIKRRNTDHE